MAPAPQTAVLMGVAGSGKSSIGSRLAAMLNWDFVDADNLHPSSNVDKMANGTPLTDEDRDLWLTAVDLSLRTGSATTVMACSALKRQYRDRLRVHNPHLTFIHLTGSPEMLAKRLSRRVDHFMPSSLLASQLDILEPLGEDEVGLTIDITAPPAAIAAAAARYLHPAAG